MIVALCPHYQGLANTIERWRYVDVLRLIVALGLKTSHAEVVYRGSPAVEGIVRIAPRSSADRGTISMAEAAQLTGVTNQQVSVWRRRLQDPEKYGPDTRAAGTPENRAQNALQRIGGHRVTPKYQEHRRRFLCRMAAIGTVAIVMAVIPGYLMVSGSAIMQNAVETVAWAQS